MAQTEQSTLDEHEVSTAIAEANEQVERDIERIEKQLTDRHIKPARILVILDLLRQDAVSSIPDEHFTTYRTPNGFDIKWRDQQLAA